MVQERLVERRVAQFLAVFHFVDSPGLSTDSIGTSDEGVDSELELVESLCLIDHMVRILGDSSGESRNVVGGFCEMSIPAVDKAAQISLLPNKIFLLLLLCGSDVLLKLFPSISELFQEFFGFLS